ncbi:hypothetical protein VTK56DRAFT_6445 [Thermocarpiscus australiensis]
MRFIGPTDRVQRDRHLKRKASLRFCALSAAIFITYTPSRNYRSRLYASYLCSIVYSSTFTRETLSNKSCCRL